MKDINQKHQTLKRYELWSELYAIADQLLKIADDWFDADDSIKYNHNRRCDIDTQSLTYHQYIAPTHKYEETILAAEKQATEKPQAVGEDIQKVL